MKRGVILYLALCAVLFFAYWWVGSTPPWREVAMAVIFLMLVMLREYALDLHRRRAERRRKADALMGATPGTSETSAGNAGPAQ